MKIVIGDRNRTFCLRLPLGLVCNRAGAALLAGGLRATGRLPGDSGEDAEARTAAITTAQVHGLLKALQRSRRALKEAGLPLLDVEESDGGRFRITL